MNRGLVEDEETRLSRFCSGFWSRVCVECDEKSYSEEGRSNDNFEKKRKKKNREFQAFMDEITVN